MALDSFRNLAYSLIATAPSPAGSGTSLVVTAAQGSRFPSAPFNATIWPADSVPTPANAEIVTVTAVSTDTLTIVRAQEGTAARTVIVGDQIAATITARTLSTLESDISIASAAATSADAHANAASAAATSVDARVNTLSQAHSALSNVVSAVQSAVSNVSVLSTGGVPTAGLQAALDALSNRISVEAPQGGGGGSVTSTEVSVVSATAAANLSVLCAALSAISAVSGATSVDGLQSVINQLSNRTSVLSHAISIASAAATSADAHAATASAAATSADGHANTVSAAVETLSAKVVSISAQLVSLEVHASAASAAATSVDGRVNTLSQAHSVLSNVVSAVQSAVSNVSCVSGAGSATGLQNVVQALSVRIAAAGGGSATPTSASYLSLQSTVSHLASIVSLVSAVSSGGSATGLQAVVNALSNRISAIPGGASTPTIGHVSAVQVISSTTLITVSGLSISVSAGGMYMLDAHVLFNIPAAGAVIKWGLNYPGMVETRGRIYMPYALSAGGGANLPAFAHWAGSDSASGSLIMSRSAGTYTTPVAMYDGVFNVSTTGTVHILGAASTGAGAISVLPASFIRVLKLN